MSDVLLEVFEVRSGAREQMIDISARIAEFAREHGGNGLATVFVPHTSAAVTINENADVDVQVDMLLWLKRLVPESREFRHMEGNSDAHIKASLIGNSVSIPFVNGQMRLGTWQGIYLCEFDGPRIRKVEVMLR